MAAKSSKTLGRPGLNQDQLAEVLGALLLLTPGSAEYRRKRRELATKFDRTERGIDTIFAGLKEKVALPPKKEPPTATNSGG